ncbi:unnamed protein product, partial [Ectocarpus fasciculatus]
GGSAGTTVASTSAAPAPVTLPPPSLKPLSILPGATDAYPPPLASAASASAVPRSIEEAREVAAVAAATAAYAAVAADARASIAAGGGVTSTSGLKVPDGQAARAMWTSLAAAGLAESSPPRFVVHLASWRKTETDLGAVAAIVQEEGMFKRLTPVLRVTRCASPAQPTQAPPGAAAAEAEKRRVAADQRRGLSAAGTGLRVLAQVLDEIDQIGGGNVGVVTNEPALVDLLSV